MTAPWQKVSASNFPWQENSPTSRVERNAHVIRLVYCVTRKPDVDPAEFSKYWRTEHVALVDRCAEVLKPRQYAQTASLLVESNWRIMTRRGTERPFDGMLEFWWKNAAEYEKLVNTRGAEQAIERLFADERRFIDHAQSMAFFTDEAQRVECCP